MSRDKFKMLILTMFKVMSCTLWNSCIKLINTDKLTNLPFCDKFMNA